MPATLEHQVEAGTVADYVSLFVPGGALSSRPRWYRGDGELRPTNALLPSIARPPSTIDREWETYQRFRQNAAAFLPHANLSDWDWMLYMRHFEAPTRLLDWTESPLVALYFAVNREADNGKDGAVWCLDPGRLNELAGLGRRIHCAGIDEELLQYTPAGVRDAPAGSQFKPVALIAPRSFPRLVAQQGVFTVIHRESVSLDSIEDPTLLSRVRIPTGTKSTILRSLNALGINRLTLYPELQSVMGGN